MKASTSGLLFGLALATLAGGCVVRGYAGTGVQSSGGGYVAVDSSPTYTVQAYPPEPMYEEVTVSPGYGYVWIDGYWHWNGYRWVWIGGRWTGDRAGYVYVSPYYDYTGGRYVYRAGYWSSRSRVRGHVYDQRDGRPATYVPDRSDRNYDYRVGVRDHRSNPPVRDNRGGGVDVRDHRDPNPPPYSGGNGPRDHRTPDNGPRDHRTPDNRGPYERPNPPTAGQGPARDTRDHRSAPNNPGRYERPNPPTAGQGPARDTRDHRSAPSDPGRYERPRPPTAGQGPARDERKPKPAEREPRDHRDKDKDKKPRHY